VLALGGADSAREMTSDGLAGMEEHHAGSCVGCAARGGDTAGGGAVDGDIGVHVFHPSTLHSMLDICK